MSEYDPSLEPDNALSAGGGETAAPRVTVERAAESAKPLVRRLLELNAHDFSEFDGRDVSEHGEFGYRYFDHYWTEPDDRQVLIIRCNGLVDTSAVIAGLCIDLVADDPGASVRARSRAALSHPGDLHDPEGASVAYLTAAAVLRL